VQSIDATLVVWGGVVGAILPPMLAIVIQPGWRAEVKGLVALVACCLVALAICWLAGDLTRREDVATTVLTVFGVAQALYATYWRPSGIAPAIERATSGESSRGWGDRLG
jgi:hypothetical protein